jgi:hypothetical protein
LFSEINRLEAIDLQQASDHCEILRRKAEGISEVEVPLIERIEGIKAALKLESIRRESIHVFSKQATLIALGVACTLFLSRQGFLLEVFGIKNDSDLYLVDGLAVGISVVAILFLINNRSVKLKNCKIALLTESEKSFRDLQSKKSANFLHPPVPKKCLDRNYSAFWKKLELRTSVLEGTNAGSVFINRMGRRFRWCPSGEFMMGSTEEEQLNAQKSLGKDEAIFQWEKRQKVLIRQGFWIAECPVTVKDYYRVMGISPSALIKRLESYGCNFSDWDEEMPMVFVNFRDAVKFCKRLTAVDIGNGTLPRGWTYRLPTDEQWE